MNFFEELRRRNVFRVAIAYVVTSWLLLQLTEVLTELLELQADVGKIVIVLLVIGFPVALIFAWAFEMTPEGVKRESEVDRGRSIAPQTGKKLDRVIIGILAIAVVMLVLDRQSDPAPEKSPAETAADSGAQRREQQKDGVAVTGQDTSIAVLPFVNMTTDAENEFFSDGISEEILNVLARIPELKVAARTSAFAFKGGNAKVSDIARELGVNHVLEGSVRKAGDQVRVTAQLIKADDGFHLWSASYDRRLDNIFAIQDEIAAAIADALKLELGLEAGQAGNLTGTRSIEAYEAYLRGMSLWHERTLASLRGAIDAFERAIELDPEFAKAHAGLALTWAVLPGYTPLEPNTAHEQIRSAASKALELDPDNAEALAALGLLERYQRRYEAAGEYFERAIEINPSFATAYQWYSSLKGDLGDGEGALEAMQQARELDPRSRIIGYNLAWRLVSQDRLPEGMAVTSEVVTMAPDFPETVGQSMLLNVIAGNCEEVRRLGNRLAGLLDKQVNSTPVYVGLCRRDDPEARERALESIGSWEAFDFANPADPALSYAYQAWYTLMELGEIDAVLDSMARWSGDTWNGIPDFRSWITENAIRLRCDSRYQAMERELDLPPPRNPVSCP